MNYNVFVYVIWVKVIVAEHIFFCIFWKGKKQKRLCEPGVALTKYFRYLTGVFKNGDGNIWRLSATFTH